MAYMTMDEAEFWAAPGRLATIQDNIERKRREVMAASPNGPYAAAIAELRSTQFTLGDSESDATPIGNFVHFPPFSPLPRHTHDCDVYMVVVAGSMYADGKVLHAGDGMTAKAHEFYGPEVAGPEGCTRVEFFATMSGLLGVIYEKKSGELVTVRPLETGDLVPGHETLVGFEEMQSLLRWAQQDATRSSLTR